MGSPHSRDPTTYRELRADTAGAMEVTMNDIRRISPEALAALGVNQIAYVKAVEIEDELRFAVHTADGTGITVFPSRELANLAIRQNEMEPVSVH